MDELQARDALVGAWRLVSWENRAADGQVTYPMGADPSGYVLYTGNGRFSITISRRAGLGSPPATCWAGRSRRRPGRWRACRQRGPLQLPWRPRDPSCGAVVVSQWVGSDPVRWVELAGGRLILSASPLPLAGRQQVPRLIWERVDPDRLGH